MKKIGFLLALVAFTACNAFAQGAKNIVINEVLTNNTASIEDEYGMREAWIELANKSFTTYNVRGMYITSDRKVLNESLSAPERQKLMSLIPSGDEGTLLTARQHILYYTNGSANLGARHLSVKVTAGQPTWIALYDGNGETLIDSISVPALAANQSYARVKDGSTEWAVCVAPTPGIANKAVVNEKIAKTKAEDPHGFAITILAMGTVFVCLALLYVFFRLLGILMDHLNTAKKIAHSQPLKPVTETVEAVDDMRHKTSVILKDGIESKGIDKEVYIAVIAMALKQYQDDVHDVESGVITISPKNTAWNAPSFNNIVK